MHKRHRQQGVARSLSRITETSATLGKRWAPESKRKSELSTVVHACLFKRLKNITVRQQSDATWCSYHDVQIMFNVGRGDILLILIHCEVWPALSIFRPPIWSCPHVNCLVKHLSQHLQKTNFSCSLLSSYSLPPPQSWSLQGGPHFQCFSRQQFRLPGKFYTQWHIIWDS